MKTTILIDDTNLAADTYYYPSAAGLNITAGYKDICLQGIISGGVTATVEATCDESAVPAFADITKSGFDLITNADNNASFVDTSFLLDYDNLNVRAIRLKIVTSDGTNSVKVIANLKAI